MQQKLLGLSLQAEGQDCVSSVIVLLAPSLFRVLRRCKFGLQVYAADGKDSFCLFAV